MGHVGGRAANSQRIRAETLHPLTMSWERCGSQTHLKHTCTCVHAGAVLGSEAVAGTITGAPPPWAPAYRPSRFVPGALAKVCSWSERVGEWCVVVGSARKVWWCGDAPLTPAPQKRPAGVLR